MNDAAAMAMRMQLGGSAAPRLRTSHASWTAMPSCAPAFGRGHVSSPGLVKQTQNDVTIETKANPAYGHRQPEEILT